MKGLAIADDLTLPMDAATRRAGLFGMPGAGKSNLARVMVEEYSRLAIPFAVIDPEGSWWGLRSAGDGKGWGVAVPIFGGDHADVPLESTGGTLMADIIVADRMSCVIDLELFSRGERTRFLTDMGERLIRKNKDPLHLILEEADDYVPQRVYHGQERMVGAWTTIVGRGRKKGIGCTAISTRPAKMSTDVRNLLDTLFVLRTTGPHDRKAILEWVKHKGLDPSLVDSLPDLNDGEAWVWSPHWLKVMKRVKVKRQWTFDSGATPDLRHKRRVTSLADVDLEGIRTRMAETIEKVKAEDPRELQKKLADALARIRQLEAAKPETKIERVSIPALSQSDIRAFDPILSRIHDTAETMIEETKEPIAMLQQFARDLNAAADVIQLKLRNVGHYDVATTPNPPEQSQFATRRKPAPADPETGKLRKGERSLLSTLARRDPRPLTKIQLATLSGLAPKSGTFSQYLSNLRRLRLIEGDGTFSRITPAGLSIVGRQPPQTVTEFLQMWYSSPSLRLGARNMLRLLVEIYPVRLKRSELAARVEMEETSGTFSQYLSLLKSNGLVVTESGEISANPSIFTELQ